MGSKHLFVKRTPLSHRLLKWGAPVLVLLILWPPMQSNVHEAIEAWTDPVKSPVALLVTPNSPPLSDEAQTAAKAAPSTPLQTSTTTETSSTSQSTDVGIANANPAALASPTSAMLPPSIDPQGEAALRSAIQQWSQAWKTRDLPAYLSLYSPNFVPPQGISRQLWADTRKARIASKQNIELSLQNLSVQMQGNTATVKFTQAYADERFRMIDRKTMVWQLAEGRWLIQSETTD
jgi:ketosteroid isomerase-like protein